MQATMEDLKSLDQGLFQKEGQNIEALKQSLFAHVGLPTMTKIEGTKRNLVLEIFLNQVSKDILCRNAPNLETRQQ